MRPLDTYNGGKNGSGVYQALINLIPPHDVFISGFMGNCGVLANKKPAAINIGFELDINIIDAWRSVHPEYFYFNNDFINIASQENALWSMAQKCATRPAADDAEICDTGPGTMTQKNALRPGHVAGKSVTVRKVTQKNATRSNVFLFCDPPYLKEVRKSLSLKYKFGMLERPEHTELFTTLSSLPSNFKIMVTHYPCDFYNELYKDWNFKDIKGRVRGGIAIERVYMNYSLPTRLHDYAFLGETKWKREKYARYKKNLVEKLNRYTEIERNFILNVFAEYSAQQNNG